MNKKSPNKIPMNETWETEKMRGDEKKEKKVPLS